MKSIAFRLGALLVIAAPLAAQTPTPLPQSAGAKSDTLTRAASTTAQDSVDDEGVPLGLQYGIASGALHYAEGRSEQSLGAVLRWSPVRWLSVSTTPTAIRASVPALTPGSQPIARGGVVDLPVDAQLSHRFGGRFAPTASVEFGVTLPIGDSASGFGTGRLGYSTNASLGFAPTEDVWVHLGAGRSLSGLSFQSAFTGASAWGDASAGYSLTDRLSVTGGYSTDLGAVDPTIGRATSVNAGFAVGLRGPLTLHLTTSHGMSGPAPSWGLVVGVGTAFPYLGHLDAGSLGDQLRNAFGGGTHGLGNGGGSSSGRGRRP